MIEITHFCFVKNKKKINLLDDDLKQVGIDSLVAGNSLWVEYSTNKMLKNDKNNDFIIGYSHSNNDGFFCKIGFKDNIFFCKTDVISAIPVFIYKKHNCVVISSSMHYLIKACKQVGIDLDLDMTSCSEMLLSSYVFTRGRTLLSNVSRMLPMHKLTLNCTDGGVNFSSMGGSFKYEEATDSWKDSISNLRSEIIKGLRRHKGKRVAVMLSGGADSRAIAAAAVLAGLKPDFFTFGQSTVNNSDFSIAAMVADRLKRPLKVYSASSKNYVENWENIALKSNWTDMWNLAKLPINFFKDISKYDIVLRGDGDGIYGWKGNAANISDILHLLEISPMDSVLKDAKWFQSPKDVFLPGERSRNKIINKYSHDARSLVDLKNILYQKHREYGCIAQNMWTIGNWVKVDAPFLWKKSLEIVAKTSKGKRTNKQLIFALVDSFDEVSDIPYSSQGSWNDELDNWIHGINDYMVNYVKENSPWSVDESRIYSRFQHPPKIMKETMCILNIYPSLRSIFQKNVLVRKYVLEKAPYLLNSSFSKRGLTRLAVLSHLNKVLNKR
jgi:hypothetical protein